MEALQSLVEHSLSTRERDVRELTAHVRNLEVALGKLPYQLVEKLTPVVEKACKGGDNAAESARYICDAIREGLYLRAKGFQAWPRPGDETVQTQIPPNTPMVQVVNQTGSGQMSSGSASAKQEIDRDATGPFRIGGDEQLGIRMTVRRRVVVVCVLSASGLVGFGVFMYKVFRVLSLLK
jgi:hypothetical protein